jgi:hypothetical protein
MPETLTPPTPPEEAAPPKRKRRLVPDLSSEIEVAGQRLTRVARVDGDPEEPRPRTLDEVARKHLGEGAASMLSEEFIRMVEEQEPLQQSSIAEEVTGRVELFTDGHAAVSHPEPDPEKREGMTMSPLVGLADEPDFLAGKKHPETIFDLFNLFPQLDGDTWWIYVERKDPKLFGGRKVSGVLRKISAPMTLAEWQYWYGGGTYKLIVYGPGKRGGAILSADGKAPSKALTEPITVTFPGIPSFACEVYDDEDDMTQSAPTGFPNIPLAGRRGPASIADANIETKKLQVDENREIRNEDAAKRERDRVEKLQQEKAQSETGMVALLLKAQERAAEREAELREQQLVREREIAEERREQDAKWEARFRSLTEKAPDDLDRLAKISNIIQKPDNSEALRDQFARELDRVQTAARAELERSADRLREEQKRADQRIEESAQRASQRIAEVEARAANAERDLRERCDRDISRIKEETDRRVNDMHRQHTDAVALLTTQHQAAVAAETRNHQRDVDSLKAQHAMAMESLKASYEMRLETSRGEVKRTSSEIERWKQEAAEGKDVLGKLRKLKEDAIELGMVPAEEAAANAAAEPETVGQMLMKMAMGTAQQLPQIVDSVGNMLKARPAQDLQAARLAGREEMIAQAGQGLAQLPPPHRRRGPQPQLGGGYVPRHISEVQAPPPIAPGVADPYTVPPQPQFQPEPLQQQQYEPQIYPTSDPRGQGFTNMPPEPQMQPAQPPPPAAAPAIAPPPAALAQVVPQAPPSMPPPPPPSMAPPPGLSPAEAEKDREILGAEQMIVPHYLGGVSAETVADQMFQQFQVEGIRNILAQLDAERVIVGITRAGNPESPFLKRAGKTYLRTLFDELRKRVS